MIKSIIQGIINSLSAADLRAAIKAAITKKKMPVEDQRQIATDVIGNLPAIEQQAVASNTFIGLTADDRKKLLKDLVSIAVAGGTGYATGGQAGAISAGVDQLLENLNKK